MSTMSESSSSSSSSSSSWSGFFLGSAVTATSILLYQNRKNLIALFIDLAEEYKQDAKDDGVKGTTTTTTTTTTTLQSPRGLEQHRLRPSMAKVAQEGIGEGDRGFLSDVLRQLWPYINIAGSDIIRNTAEPMFKEMLPGPLSTLQFTKIDLGSVPIALDNIVVHDVNLETNTLQCDMDVVWDGNCHIKLKADYMASFGVKSVKLRGRLSLLLRPLVPTTSIVGAVQYAFINKPEISLKYSGLAHLADFKIIDDTIKEILVSTFDTMMVLPRRRLKKMDPLCDYSTIFQPPLGIARVTVKSGRGFVVDKGILVDDIPDCYCNVKLGNSKYRTRTIPDNLAPVWNETMDFVLADHDQVLDCDVWNSPEGSMDKHQMLGKVSTTPGEILLAGNVVELALHHGAQTSGAFITLGCEILRLTTSNLDSLTTHTAATTDTSKQLCGLLTILILRAFHLPLTKEEAATFVRVTCGTDKFTTTSVYDYPGVDCLNPSYDKGFWIELKPEIITNGKLPEITLQLINGVDTNLGSLVISHDTLAAAPDHTLAETQPIGNKGAKLQFHICLQGVEPPQSKDMVLEEDEYYHVSLPSEAGLSEEVARDLTAKAVGQGVSMRTVGQLRGLPTLSPLKAVMSKSADGAEKDEEDHEDGAETSPRQRSSGREDSDIFMSARENVSDESRPAPSNMSRVRITAVSGKGFVSRKLAFFLPEDIPDAYLKITFGSSPQIWRTKTIKNNKFPVWNESKEYVLHSHGQVINVDVYDEDEGNKETKDVYIGSVRITVGKVLLAGGVTQQQVLREGKGTGVYVTLKCQLVKN